MNSDFSSASERSELFKAAMIRAKKLTDYCNATSARYSETMEAIQALPKAERKPHVKPLVELFELKLTRMMNAISALNEFLKCADMAPDFAKRGSEKFIDEIRATYQATLADLKKLQS